MAHLTKRLPGLGLGLLVVGLVLGTILLPDDSPPPSSKTIELRAEDGTRLAHPTLYYTLNRRRP